MIQTSTPIEGKKILDTILFPQWNRVLKESTACRPIDKFNLKELNKKVNATYKYQADNIDYWSCPAEFLNNKGGDCEDFAIYKYYLLPLPKYIAIGLVDFKQCHAVCVVYCQDYKDWVVLDILTNDIIPWQDYLRQFTVIYLCAQEGVYL